MSVLTLDTVYETYAARQHDTAPNGDPARPGSIEWAGGDINVYWSNNELGNPPANAAAMAADPNNPLTGGGIVTVNPAARWVLVEAAAGAPVVKAFRVAVVPNP